MQRLTLITALLLGLAACSQEASDPGDKAASTPAADTATPSAAPVLAQDSGIENRGSEAAGGDNWWDALPRPDWANYREVKTYHPWFEVYEIQDGVFAIYEPGQFEEVISWLIVGRQQALLFDTGLGMGDIRGVVRELTKHPIVVLNSHSHYDHVGGNHQFDIIMGRNLAFTKENADGKSNAEVGEFAGDEWIWKQHPPNFDARSYAIEPWEFTNWIEDQQFIDLGGVSLEILFAPGHAPDGVVLVDHQRRLMFMGDVFYPAPLYAHLEGSSVEAYANTAARLAELQDAVDFLLPSHNVPIAESRFLGALDAAFRGILDGSAEYTVTPEGREYVFEGFSVLTPDPPVVSTGTIELL